MDYCKIHFGKSLNDLSYQDILGYFQTERIETDQMEFKSLNSNGDINAKFPKLIESVSGFLNSSGGILIWGAPEGVKPSGKKEKVFIGDLTPFGSELEKDWLISKISDSIIPLPNQINAKILDNKGTCICVFEIQESEYAPHQTSHTYYMRIDGQTKPAPHHYVEALFKKIRYPNIEAHLQVLDAAIEPDRNYKILVRFVFFNWSPLQNEENLSFNLIAAHGRIKGSAPGDSRQIQIHEGSGYFRDRIKDVFYYGQPIEETVEIFYNRYLVQQEDFKVPLVLSFAGRFSPMKTSEYMLHLNFEHNISNKSQWIQGFIISKNENRLIKDIKEEMGISKEKSIKVVMDRQLSKA